MQQWKTALENAIARVLGDDKVSFGIFFIYKYNIQLKKFVLS